MKAPLKNSAKKYSNSFHLKAIFKQRISHNKQQNQPGCSGAAGIHMLGHVSH